MRRYRIEHFALYAKLATNNCPTHTIGYQMVYPNDQNPKNPPLFYLLQSVPEAAGRKSPELRARGLGV